MVPGKKAKKKKTEAKKQLFYTHFELHSLEQNFRKRVLDYAAGILVLVKLVRTICPVSQVFPRTTRNLLACGSLFSCAIALATVC